MVTAEASAAVGRLVLVTTEPTVMRLVSAMPVTTALFRAKVAVVSETVEVR